MRVSTIQTRLFFFFSPGLQLVSTNRAIISVSIPSSKTCLPTNISAFNPAPLVKPQISSSVQSYTPDTPTTEKNTNPPPAQTKTPVPNPFEGKLLEEIG